MRIPLVDDLIERMDFFDEPINNRKFCVLAYGLMSFYAFFVTFTSSIAFFSGVEHRFLSKPLAAVMLAASWFSLLFMLRLTVRLAKREG